MMQKKSTFMIFLICVFLLGNILHISFFNINEILKVADSFAYLQMAEYLHNFSLEGFGTGWFGPFYSFFISLCTYLFQDAFLSAQVLNIILFNISAFLLYKISQPLLSPKYRILVLFLFFLSPVLLHFNIAILSENIYIPLFLFIVLLLQGFLQKPQVFSAILFSFLIAFMYLTRGEAFIYLGALGIISLILVFKKDFSIKQFLGFNTLLFLFFGLFIFPYVYYLHTFTGNWGLSNKGSSNLRQATLRGKDKMDDGGFEQAVGELTPDSQHLISGFAGGLVYDTPVTGITLQKYIGDNFNIFVQNWGKNQQKLYFKNLPHIIVGNAVLLYYNKDSHLFYQNIPFFLIILTPLLLLFLGFFSLIKNKQNDILIILGSFFFIASFFFTLFFTLNRYFIIFIPLFLIIIVYAIQTLDAWITFSWSGFHKKSLNKNNFSGKIILKLSIGIICVGVYALGIITYYNSYKNDDSTYLIKKEAGEWLKEYHNDSYPDSSGVPINILERFPVVTYYSATPHRFITPYTSSLNKLLTYAQYNNIDYLIVDTLDFRRYRPQLKFLLDENKTYIGLKKIKVFKKSFMGKVNKVIIYQIKK